MDKIFTDSKYDKLFQLVVYTIMYECHSVCKPDAVQAGIISTHEINKNNPNYILFGNILGDSDILKYKSEFSKRLSRLFLEIFDEETPFMQTDDIKRCKNCEFLHLCGRQTVTEGY